MDVSVGASVEVSLAASVIGGAPSVRRLESAAAESLLKSPLLSAAAASSGAPNVAGGSGCGLRVQAMATKQVDTATKVARRQS